MADLPAGFVLDDPNVGAALPQGFAVDQPPPQQSYVGSVLPFSKDTQGKVSFDPNAGIMGGIKNLAQAALAPGQVYSGALPTPYSGSGSSTASPQVIDRAIGLASMATPVSAALRAGEVIPGEALAQSVPSAQQLKDVGAAGYDAARASPYAIAGSDVANMAQQVQQSLLNNHGIIPQTAPKTYALLNDLSNPPPGAVATYPGLEAARRGLSTLTTEGGTEGFAAQRAIPQLDQFIDAISPDAANARANYAAAMRSNSLTGDLDRANTGILEQAEARAHAGSGANLGGAIRGRVATLLQNPDRLAGFSQPEIDALNNVVQGSPVANTARWIGDRLGGRPGLGSMAATALGATLGGHLAPGAEGIAIGATLPTAIGVSAKGLENSLTRRALNNVDEMVRTRSPLADVLSGLTAPFRGYGGPAMGANNAFARGVLPPLLSPQNLSPQDLPPSPLAQFLARGGA